MPPLLPDPFTALGMTAAVAFAMAWVMRILGHAFWLQGMSWAMASTVMYGLAHAGAAMYVQRQAALWGLLAALAFNAAFALLALAIQRFRRSHHSRRDWVTLLLPITATLFVYALGPWLNTAWRDVVQSSVLALQILFVLGLLLRIRHSVPGTGWLWLCAALAVQCMGYGLHIVSALQPDFFVSPSSAVSWLLGLLPMVQWMATNVGFLVMLRDKETALEWHKAQRDPLTQLPNRAALVQHLCISMEQAAQLQQPMAIMVLDIDHFKSVNDSYGHLVGDQVIQSVAKTLLQHVRTSDFAARYGGEEFVVVLMNAPAREAFRIADRLCQSMRNLATPLANGQSLRTTISIGVYAGYPAHGASWERWVGAADEAMYRAKNNGRDRVFMSGPVQAMQSDAPQTEVEPC